MGKSAKRKHYLKKFKSKNTPVKFHMHRNIRNDVIAIVISGIVIISYFIIHSHM